MIVTIDVCDACGDRYYSVEILHTVHEVAMGARCLWHTGTCSPERTEQIPVSHLESA